MVERVDGDCVVVVIFEWLCGEVVVVLFVG